MHSSLTNLPASIFPVLGWSCPPNDFPVHDAIVQTLEAVWSDLFAMVSGTALEADAEDSAGRSSTSTTVPRPANRLQSIAQPTVRALLATADGSGVIPMNRDPG